MASMRWRIPSLLLLPLLAAGLALSQPAMIMAGMREATRPAQHHQHHDSPHSPSHADCCEWCAACCATGGPVPTTSIPLAAVASNPPTDRLTGDSGTRAAPAAHLLPFSQGPPALLV